MHLSVGEFGFASGKSNIYKKSLNNLWTINSSWKIHSWTLKTLCYSTRHSSSQETVQLLSSSSVSVGASPCRTSGTESAHQCSRHRSLIPGLGRSPGGGHGNLPQYSHLENPHGQRRLVGHSPEGDEVLDTTEATYVHEG